MSNRKTTNAYIGQRFGRLLVTGIAKRDKHRHIRFECLCDCGNTHIALANNIRRGSTSSCGCIRKEMAAERLRKSEEIAEHRLGVADAARRRRVAFVGSVFERLTVTDLIVDGKKVRYKCNCECGGSTITSRANLERGHTKSCGCYRIYKHPERRVGLRKLYYRYTHRAKRRKQLFEIELADFAEITSKACSYCGSPPTCEMRSRSDNSSYSYNGLDRIDSSLGYVEANIVPCCWVCNRMKSDMGLDDFLRHVAKIANHSADHVTEIE